jgi:hypothetical protein
VSIATSFGEIASYRAHMPPGKAQRVGALQIGVFLDELALLAVFGIAGAQLGTSTVASTLLAILLPVAAGVAWGRWLAPRARGRLAYPARLVAKLALFAAASVVLAATGPIWWAAAFLAVSVALVSGAELQERPRPAGS